MKSDVISWTTSSFWYLGCCVRCVPQCIQQLKSGFCFVIYLTVIEQSFPVSCTKVEDVLRWCCLLLMLFSSWSTSILLLDSVLSSCAPSPVLLVALRSCPQCRGSAKQSCCFSSAAQGWQAELLSSFHQTGNACPQLQWLQHVPEVRSTFNLAN